MERRRKLRVNNPVSFGILCAMVLVFAVAAVYSLAIGVVVPGVRKIQAMNATPSPTPLATPTPELTPLLLAGTEDLPEITPTPDPTPTPAPTPIPGGKLYGKTIGIDPARGYDSKIKGVSSGIYANRINFNLAQVLKPLLEAEGAVVILTYDDVTQSPTEESRVKVLNNGKIDVALRIDVNSVKSPDTRGAMAWIPSKHEKMSDCQRLAETVLESYVAATGMPRRISGGTAIQKKSDKDVLNDTSAPVAILFLGHISNKADDAKINADDARDTIAQSIVNGLIAYFG